MKKHEFRENELSEKAFEVYSNSDFVFYTDNGYTFYASDNVHDTPDVVGNGTLQDVEEFLLQFE